MLSNIKMPIGEALMTSLVGIITVITILAVIAVLIILVSKAIRAIENSANKNNAKAVSSAPAAPTATMPSDMNRGNVELVNTDEKTAAVIMAIVSQKSGIPLNRLAFKSIKLKEDK